MAKVDHSNFTRGTVKSFHISLIAVVWTVLWIVFISEFKLIDFGIHLFSSSSLSLAIEQSAVLNSVPLVIGCLAFAISFLRQFNINRKIGFVIGVLLGIALSGELIFIVLHTVASRYFG